jgi:L,D-transpeptidase YbiS
VRVGLNELRGLARSLENRVRKLEANQIRLYPGGPVILVDTSRSRISLMLGSRVVAEGTCSTGNGMELRDSTGKRSWTFDTPRGYFRVLSKVANPVWYRPDWSYIEEGEPIPKDRSKRAEANVLGDYAIAFGNGFFIHGTLYTRLLGANVTHGCIRVDDTMLKKLYAAAQPGTPIWIY